RDARAVPREGPHTPAGRGRAVQEVLTADERVPPQPRGAGGLRDRERRRRVDVDDDRGLDDGHTATLPAGRRRPQTTSICGAYSRMIASACSCASGVEPAHPAATTRTRAPASAAGSAVEMTQQSVETPTRVSV